MRKYSIQPRVNEVREFLEIANDFANPLDLVREAISNSFDAKANTIKLHFNVEREKGEDIFVIYIEDDGNGMDKDKIRAFFDLGNSTNAEDSDLIGEKGHGTKVYFNSKKIEVETSMGRGFPILIATMNNPYSKLCDKKIPNVSVEENENSNHWKGTKITIRGYNNNRREKFTHELLKDHVLWFTKFGSFEREINIEDNKDKKLFLKGIDRSEEEQISYGHVFPRENKNVDELYKQHGTVAPKFYVRKWITKGFLPNAPEKTYQAVFCIEGDGIKRQYNPMLRRPGHTPEEGSYTVRERYGLWLCKDFIPVQQKNEWIVEKGNEYLRFHAFFNCQDFRLTANRGSVENTPSEIMADVETEVRKLYKKITSSEDWSDLESLEGEVAAIITSEREKSDFEIRIRRSRLSRIAEYQGNILVEPVKENKYYSEHGVYSLLLILKILNPDLFPFEIIDYDTHFGIDVIARERSDIAIDRSQLSYIEFKGKLTDHLNHSFKYLRSIICYDTDVLDGGSITDIANEERTMEVISASDAQNSSGYTKYFLTNRASNMRIEVFVLKDYLREKLGIEFRPRAS